MTRFVLDASVALGWFLDEPVPPYARQVYRALRAGARALVPALWQIEIANSFVVAERRGNITAVDLNRCLYEIEELLVKAIESSTDFISVKDALGSARAFQLTAYDAVYLETARRERLPLATLDNSLRNAASRAGVELFR